MKNRLLAGILALLAALSLTGCQLARADGQSPAHPQRDRLAGVLVTREHLDLFDMEGYLNDNLGDLASGGLIIADESGKYQGRLYASPVTRTLTGENGETTQTEEYAFEDVEGMAYFAAYTGEGEDLTLSVIADDAISDGNTHIISTDGGEMVELSGAIFVSAQGEAGPFYMNPVYQSGDGRVYVMEGSGIQGDTEGGAFSQTLEETVTQTVDEESREYGAKITISVSAADPAEKITVIEMDGENRVAAQREYEPGGLPDVLTPAKDAEYIIVQTHLPGGGASREIYDRGADSFTTFYPREDGICVKRTTSLLWEEGKAPA